MVFNLFQIGYFMSTKHNDVDHWSMAQSGLHVFDRQAWVFTRSLCRENVCPCSFNHTALSGSTLYKQKKENFLSPDQHTKSSKWGDKCCRGKSICQKVRSFTHSHWKINQLIWTGNWKLFPYYTSQLQSQNIYNRYGFHLGISRYKWLLDTYEQS